MKGLKIAVLVLILVLVYAPAVYAVDCQGLFCNAFGATDRAEIRAARDVEIARIEAEGAERLKAAEMQLAREVEQGKLTQEQARVQADMFRQAVMAATQKEIRQVELEYEQAATVIAGQVDVALEGVRQAGATTRWRIGTDAGVSLVAVVIIGAVLILFMRRQNTQRPSVLILPGGAQWPPGLAQKPEFYELPDQVYQVQHPLERRG